MPRIVAVVVTYNRLKHLQTAIAALLPQTCEAIVVVDNCSTDGTREWLASEAKENACLNLVLAPNNLGGAGGFELGFRHAVQNHSFDWLVCFDDDAYPHPDAFEAFLSSDLEGAAAAAAAVYFPNGNICEMNRPAINPFWQWKLFLKTISGQGRKGFHLPDEAYLSRKPIAIDTTSFVGFFIRREWVEKIGFPEGRMFLYGDDVLYSLTLRKAGGRISFLPWVKFTHDCAATSTHEKVIKPLWKVYYAYRNSLRVYHASAAWLFWLFLPIKVVKWLSNARHYEQPSVYLKLTFIALKDAALQSYNRKHAKILELAKAK